MTIRRGEDWGGPGIVPPGTPFAGSDQALASLFTYVPGAERALDGPDVVILGGGDLARTVGASSRTAGSIAAGDPVTVLPIDLGVLEHDGGPPIVFAASLVARRRLWGPGSLIVCNAAFVGQWNVAPRGHPNDGRLDLVVSELGFGDRIKARSRLPSGSHIPHPDLSIRRVRSTELTLPKNATALIDGHRQDISGDVRISAVPDATSVAI